MQLVAFVVKQLVSSQCNCLQANPLCSACLLAGGREKENKFFVNGQKSHGFYPSYLKNDAFMGARAGDAQDVLPVKKMDLGKDLRLCCVEKPGC